MSAVRSVLSKLNTCVQRGRRSAPRKAGQRPRCQGQDQRGVGVGVERHRVGIGGVDRDRDVRLRPVEPQVPEEGPEEHHIAEVAAADDEDAGFGHGARVRAVGCGTGRRPLSTGGRSRRARLIRGFVRRCHARHRPYHRGVSWAIRRSSRGHDRGRPPGILPRILAGIIDVVEEQAPDGEGIEGNVHGGREIVEVTGQDHEAFHRRDVRIAVSRPSAGAPCWRKAQRGSGS